MNVSRHFIKTEPERVAGQCEITNGDLIDIPISSQPFLRVLKEKGAPVLGMCYLMLDEHYKWSTYKDDEFLSIVVKWEPKGN